jgi:hypothetical protein
MIIVEFYKLLAVSVFELGSSYVNKHRTTASNPLISRVVLQLLICRATFIETKACTVLTLQYKYSSHSTRRANSQEYQYNW